MLYSWSRKWPNFSETYHYPWLTKCCLEAQLWTWYYLFAIQMLHRWFMYWPIFVFLQKHNNLWLMKDAIESSRLIWNPSNVILSIVLIFIQYLSWCFSIVRILKYLVQYPSINSCVILYHIYNKYAKRLLNMYLLLVKPGIYLCVRYILIDIWPI